MVDALLDTAILVDLLRNHPPAVEWLAHRESLGTTPVVWLEIIEGSQSSRSQREALRLLRRFERVDLVQRDFDWAIRQALAYRLSHNVDMMDCLIAAVSHRLEIPLYTPNLKHFVPMLSDLAQKPY